ncbi:hypothetical protein DL96DRAFT_1814525 [Flagelloscypha sp. PMI_526]|nr:hypothetical protein DL96DRAFT_1814525 [Flagelloscypha sp. PMI_526]
MGHVRSGTPQATIATSLGLVRSLPDFPTQPRGYSKYPLSRLFNFTSSEASQHDGRSRPPYARSSNNNVIDRSRAATHKKLTRYPHIAYTGGLNREDRHQVNSTSKDVEQRIGLSCNSRGVMKGYRNFQAATKPRIPLSSINAPAYTISNLPCRNIYSCTGSTMRTLQRDLRCLKRWYIEWLDWKLYATIEKLIEQCNDYGDSLWTESGRVGQFSLTEHVAASEIQDKIEFNAPFIEVLRFALDPFDRPDDEIVEEISNRLPSDIIVQISCSKYDLPSPHFQKHVETECPRDGVSRA